MLTITPLHPLFAARIGGLDLTQDLDDATFATVREAFALYSVLVFPGQRITDGQQVRFSERFGQLEETRAGANGAGSKLIVLTTWQPMAAASPHRRTSKS
jgi:alpha-ketoglutarate-dependent 2,4-dichlorophenoxyacetate dioxygenase